MSSDSAKSTLVQATKSGGRVVYSTCSISPLENDQVVAKTLSSLQGQMQISISSSLHQMLKEPSTNPIEPAEVSTSLAELLHRLGAEATEHGVLVLPDKAGSGPMYVCLLLKSTAEVMISGMQCIHRSLTYTCLS